MYIYVLYSQKSKHKITELLYPLLQERVLGFHILSPNTGEITQGYGVAMRLGATKEDFDGTIGIHPTVSENFTTMYNTKSSGVNVATQGC